MIDVQDLCKDQVVEMPLEKYDELIAIKAKVEVLKKVMRNSKYVSDIKDAAEMLFGEELL